MSELDHIQISDGDQKAIDEMSRRAAFSTPRKAQFILFVQLLAENSRLFSEVNRLRALAGEPLLKGKDIS